MTGLEAYDRTSTLDREIAAVGDTIDALYAYQRRLAAWRERIDLAELRAGELVGKLETRLELLASEALL